MIATKRGVKHIAKFTDDWIASLKDRINIVDFLSKYMFVARAGNKYKACCPFHMEKTPSFVINPDEGYYHCFGCGKSGNVISFLMDHERLSYPEALEFLAHSVNMPLPENETPSEISDRRKKEEGYEIMRSAARFYYSCLADENIGIEARKYLEQRNISAAVIKEFGIGYSPDFTTLVLHLMSKGYSREMLKFVGLVHETNDGNLIDFFAKRLVIPIMSPFDKVIAFGGRSIDSTSKGAKYKNSEETPLFLKRNTLFGVNLFKKNRTKENFKFAILVEGYMDAISLYQAGIKNVVASMGTALHIEQCKVLKKLVDMVYVCFDGDTAGREATWKSLDKLAEVQLDVRVISLPDGMDPDDVIKKMGKESFSSLVDKSLPMYDFMITSLASRYDLKVPNDVRKFTSEAISLLVKLDSISQDVYIKLISNISAISETTLKNSLNNLHKNSSNAAKKQDAVEDAQKQINPSTISDESRSQIIAARFVLSMYFTDKSSAILGDLREEFFEYAPHSRIYKYIMDSIEERKTPRAGDLFDLMSDYPNEVRKMLDAVNLIAASERSRYYRNSLNILTRRIELRRKIEILNSIKETQDPDEKSKLLEQLHSITESLNQKQ
ncbi:MAG: DNA primase [Christensenellaceae bacterium]|nr:DNA primase [Christensenellaceae bacterium]